MGSEEEKRCFLSRSVSASHLKCRFQSNPPFSSEEAAMYLHETMVQSINTFVNSTKEKLHSKIIIKSQLHNTLIANLVNSYNISYL